MSTGHATRRLGGLLVRRRCAGGVETPRARPGAWTRLVAFAFVLLAPAAAPAAMVRVIYLAPTGLRSDLPPTARQCVADVGTTHVHPSWRGFDRVEMMAVGGDYWAVDFADVPSDTALSLRVSDANACLENPTGAATHNVFANGVLLTEVVPTPGTGTEPGLAFSVRADGTVSAGPGGSPPAFRLSLNQAVFGPGEPLSLVAALGQRAASTPLLDVYVVLRLPDGRVFSLFGGGVWVPGIMPVAAGIGPGPFFVGRILSAILSGSEPAGPFTFFAALTVHGTSTLVGEIAELPFVVTR